MKIRYIEGLGEAVGDALVHEGRAQHVHLLVAVIGEGHVKALVFHWGATVRGDHLADGAQRIILLALSAIAR